MIRGWPHTIFFILATTMGSATARSFTLEKISNWEEANPNALSISGVKSSRTCAIRCSKRPECTFFKFQDGECNLVLRSTEATYLFFWNSVGDDTFSEVYVDKSVLHPGSSIRDSLQKKLKLILVSHRRDLKNQVVGGQHEWSRDERPGLLGEAQNLLKHRKVLPDS